MNHDIPNQNPARADGAQRAWEYRNRMLRENGYYTADELIDMAEAIGFTLFDPFVRIHRGTVIGAGVRIGEGCAVEGEGVVLGSGTVLQRAILSGSHLQFGAGNVICGDITLSGLACGAENRIAGIDGENRGRVRIGDRNRIARIRIDNPSGGEITVGDENELAAGLSINIPFAGGAIYIGHGNSLGRDGGTVVSSSYRFGRGWSGPIAIGCGVETTRGAEILGFSALGWPLPLLAELGRGEEELAALFTAGGLEEVQAWMELLLREGPSRLAAWRGKTAPVSLFGTVKVKRCCLVGKVKIKDDTRVQCTYARDILIPERCKIYYAAVTPTEHILTMPLQDAALERRTVKHAAELHDLPTESRVDEYPLTDADFYRDHRWDRSEGRRT